MENHFSQPRFLAISLHPLSYVDLYQKNFFKSVHKEFPMDMYT